MIEQVIIQNYKSIKDLKLPLKQINVLIGSNGVGKSNFISFFELTKSIYEQNFGAFTLEKGGIDSLLYRGRQISERISGVLDFDNTNAFYFHIKPKQSEKGYIEESGDYFNANEDSSKNYYHWSTRKWDVATDESSLREMYIGRARYVKNYLNSFTIYHFHDTSSTSPMRGSCNINDNYNLKHNGSNLAAYLYKLSIVDTKAFKLIEATVRSIAPYFKRFNLRENPNVAGTIQLEWEENGSDMYLNGYSFSDGTLRFIALATLLLQSKLPEAIIIDEPELGLHPAAIDKFAALVNRASNSSQIIISTQSTNVVNNFEVKDIITVDRGDSGESIFKHLSKDDLSVWMDEYNYSISELWEKNIIGGQL
ncbi:MAG: AAA family ATPase [Rikenellaceae bacterium]